MTHKEKVKQAKAFKREEAIKLFSDTANLFGRFCRSGVIHMFGQSDGIIRVSKEEEAEMFRLFTLYSEKGLI